MLYLIVAYDNHQVIGKDNQMPWHFKEDLAYFKKITLGHTVFMGRKTYESILKMTKKPLPNRKNIVLSKTLIDDKVEVIDDLETFIKAHQSSSEIVFIIGGAMVYEATLPYAKRLYITHIDHTYEGDTYFPNWNLSDFSLIKSESFPPLTFNIYERRSS